MSNIETQTRCEDDFHLLSTIFTDIVYNTIHNIAIHKSESNSNIRLEDLYISSLQLFNEEIKKYSTFKKIIIQFINTIQIHTDYKNIGFESTIYRLFHHFIINQNKNYEYNDQVKFLNKLFVNTYSKFIKIIIESYIKIILFDRQNIEYHQKLQEIFFDILINEKKIFQTPSNAKYSSKINVIQLVNDFSILKEKFILQQKKLEYYKSKYNESSNTSNFPEKDNLLKKIEILENDNKFINDKNVKLLNDNDNLTKMLQLENLKNSELSNEIESLNNSVKVTTRSIKLTKPIKPIKSTKSTKSVKSTKSFKNSTDESENDSLSNNSDTDNNEQLMQKKKNKLINQDENKEKFDEIDNHLENIKLNNDFNDNNILFSDIDSDSDDNSNNDNKSLFLK